MKTEAITVETDSRGLARITLNRPEVKNAMNAAMIAEIGEAIRGFGADEKVRAIVIAGAGDAFCAGADLAMMQKAAAFTEAENKKEARRLAELLHAVMISDKPVIALVHGACMGGAVGLVSACDIVIAAEDSFFALSEARLGLVPAMISPFVMQAIGPRQARRFFLTGERFDAETARRIGLAHLTCLKTQLEGTLDGVLKNLLACGPAAQKEAKALIRAVAFRAIDDAVMDETVSWIARVRASAEGKEGVSAFLEKRKPNWVARG